MDNEEEKQKEGKGFAGLSSMVSDVDDVVASTQEKAQKTHSDPSPEQSASKSTQQAQKTATKPASQTSQAPGQPSGGSSGGKWLIGIAVVIGLIWLANQSDNNRPSRSTYSPGSSASTAPASQLSISQPQVPSRPSESKPSVGRNNVLSIAEIRYCLAEKIRLDAAETVLNNYSDSDVDRFNAYVNDYNSRCGEFRYRQGAPESARRDVNPYSGQLQAEGRSRFVRSSAATARAPVTTSSSKPSRPTPDATVLAIQRRLNELGYNAGTPDGLFGNKTRAAIQAFQRDQKIAVTGIADPAVLRLLQQASPRSKIELSESVESAQKSVSRTPEVQLPRASTDGKPNLSTATSWEQAAIENACDYYRRNRGAGEYYGCLRKELSSLASSGGRPDISRASSSEQAAIENACDYYKRNRGPGEYYSCLRKEMSSLASSGGRPDISRASRSEQAAIENACDYYKRNRGSGEYYNCLRKEMSSLASSGGRPDLSRASSTEQVAIENACDYYKRNRGPGEYYGCLRKELSSLAGSGGRPDISRVSRLEQASIEKACDYYKRNRGPGEYYSCLRKELASLGFR